MMHSIGKFFRGLVKVFAAIPALLGGFVPVLKACPPCPVCMPIYCGILSLVGLELADYGVYLVPAMLISMVLTLGSMIYQTRRYHKNYLFCVIAILACSSILLGKFAFDQIFIVYVGMGGFLTAIILNRRAVKSIRKPCCSKHSA